MSSRPPFSGQNQGGKVNGFHYSGCSLGRLQGSWIQRLWGTGPGLGRGVLTGLQKRQVLPISQPTENSQFSNCEPNVNILSVSELIYAWQKATSHFKARKGRLEKI